MTKSTGARVWWLAAVIAALGIAFSMAACGSDDDSDSEAAGDSGGGGGAGSEVVDFSMGRFLAPTTILAGEAEDGFGNLPMKAIDVESGPIALPLLSTGELAGIADVSENPIVIAYSRDIPVKIVWTSNKTPLALVAKQGISDAESLRGKKVAAAGGSVLQYQLERYLDANGMKLSDVDFVDLLPPDMVGAFKNGAIDAGYSWPPASTAMVGQGGAEIDKTQSTNLTIFSEEFVKENPATVQAFVCGMAAVHDDFVQKPDEVYSALGKRLNLSGDEVRPLLPEETIVQPADMLGEDLLAPGGRIAQQITDVGKWLLDSKQVEKAPSLEEVNAMIDTSYVEGVNDGKCG